MLRHLILFSGLQFLANGLNIGYFWQITDFHLDIRYGKNVSERSTKEYFLGGYDEGCWTEKRGKFGDFSCDSPLSLIESATNFIKKYEESSIDPADFIIWTGDDTAHADESVFTRDEVLDTIEVISAKISSIGLPVFPALGNHDIIPKNQFPTPDSWTTYYQNVADIWNKTLKIEKDTLQQFEENGGFYKVDWANFTLLSLNTNLWYKSNHQVQGFNDPADQFRWLEHALNSTQTAGKKALIFGHIPPGKFERFYQFCGEEKGCDTNGGYHGFHWLSPKFNERYLEIIETFSETVSGQLFAHHHTDSFKAFMSSDSDAPISWALLAPGVSPMNSTLAPETGPNNPGLRRFKYEKDTGYIVDYDQFYLNLSKVNSDETDSWELEYSFLDYYSLPELSTQEIANLILDIDSNRTVFEKYYSANTVKFEEATESNCDANCMRYHFCALYQQDYKKFEDCVAPSFSVRSHCELPMSIVATIYIVYTYTSSSFLNLQ